MGPFGNTRTNRDFWQNVPFGSKILVSDHAWDYINKVHFLFNFFFTSNNAQITLYYCNKLF